jgi:hypothetical protein
MRAPQLLLLFAVLSGCASTVRDGDPVYVGVVESVSLSERQAEPQGTPFAFDASGQVARGPVPVRRTQVYDYRVVTPDGEVAAQADEKFAIGDCVEVSGRLVAGAPRTFAYGETRMTRSSRCGVDEASSSVRPLR